MNDGGTLLRSSRGTGRASIDYSACHDDELFEYYRGGNDRALKQLMVRHERLLKWVIRQRCPEGDDVADILQDALLKATTAIDSYRKECSVRSWLVTITRTVAIDHARRRQRRQWEYLDEDMDTQICRQMSMERSFNRFAVQQALKTLPTEFREALLLIDVYGYCESEVAAAQQVSVGTIKSRRARARQLLRQELMVADDAVSATS